MKYLLLFIVIFCFLSCKKDATPVIYDVNKLKDYNFYLIRYNAFGVDTYGKPTVYFNDTTKYLFPESNKLLILSNMYFGLKLNDYFFKLYNEVYYTMDSTTLEYQAKNDDLISFTSQKDTLHIIVSPKLTRFSYRNMKIIEFNDRKLKVQFVGISGKTKKDSTFIKTLVSEPKKR